MLAVLGFLGLAMSSFVMLGRDDSDEDAPSPDEPEIDTTGLTEIGPGLYQMLSDTNGDAGAGGVLGEDADDMAGSDDADRLMQPLPATADLAVDEDMSDTIPAPDALSEPEVITGSDAIDDPEEDYGDELIADGPPAPARQDGTEGDDALDGGLGDDDIAGGDGDDALTGNMGDDALSGDAGDDTLTGGDGADALFGGEGDDTLAAGWGNDVLVGGSGQDLLNGGGGDDILDGQDVDNGFDYLNGGAGDDVLLAGRGDHLNGGEGDDLFGLLTDGQATIDDFDPAHDRLEVAYTGDVPPVLSTATDAEGVTLMADDTVVARLSGVAALDLSTVVLIAT